MIASVAAGAAGLLALIATTVITGSDPAATHAAMRSVAAAPPDTEPEQGGTAFERQLAELSFAMFLAVERGVDAGAFSCTEPRSLDESETLTCFALIGNERVIAATTTVSGASGVYDFDVVSDHVVSDDAVPGDVEPDDNLTGPGADRADAAISSYGDGLNSAAAKEIDALLSDPQGTVAAVTAWAWDAATSTLTVGFSVNPSSTFSRDTAAWIVARAQSAHWTPDRPFRDPAATLRPRLVLVVDGTEYVSDFDLIVQVAEQRISMADWVASARPS